MTNEKRGFNLKKKYVRAWKYLGVCKNFVFIAIMIFIFMALIGYFVPVPEGISEKIFQYINEILLKTEGLSPLGLFRFIFLNNIQSSFFSMILGVFFGLFPIFSSIANGYLVGFVSSLSVGASGVVSLWRLLPHGIFELPAIFISIGMGIKLGDFFIEKIFKIEKKLTRALIIFGLIIIFPLISVILYNILSIAFLTFVALCFFVTLFLALENKEIKKELGESINVFLLIVFPLLIIAGIIEAILIFFS